MQAHAILHHYFIHTEWPGGLVTKSTDLVTSCPGQGRTRDILEVLPDKDPKARMEFSGRLSGGAPPPHPHPIGSMSSGNYRSQSRG